MSTPPELQQEYGTLYFFICKLTFDLLTLKVVSESRVTWPTSVPILVFLGLSVLDLGPMYAAETSDVRQTDVRRASSFNAPRQGHNNSIDLINLTHEISSLVFLLFFLSKTLSNMSLCCDCGIHVVTCLCIYVCCTQLVTPNNAFCVFLSVLSLIKYSQDMIDRRLHVVMPNVASC